MLAFHSKTPRNTMLNLQTKIMTTAVGLVIVCQITTIGLALLTVKSSVAERAIVNLEREANMTARVTSSQASQAEGLINALVSDFGFKQAIATNDIPTIKSALDNQAERAAADVAFLIDRDQQLIATTDPLSPALKETQQLLNSAESKEIGHTVMILDGTAYFIITKPVRAPLPIAWLSVGYALDDAYAIRAEQLLGMQISIFSVAEDNPILLASVLPAAARADLTLQFSKALKADTFLSPDKILIGDQEYFAVRKPFFRNQKLLQILITQPNQEVMSVYSLIRQTLLFLGAFPLIIALIAALLFSRKLTRPLKDLVSAAKRIQDGDYEQTVTIDTSDEFNEFAIAFNAMQKEIGAREARIVYQAKHDGLTGLYNREFAIDNLGIAIAQASQANEQLAIMIVSLNASQEISATLGHEIADAYLEKAANKVRSFVSRDYIVARLELDTFLIILTKTNVEGAKQIADDFVARLVTGIRLPNVNIAVTPRIGIAIYPQHGETHERLMLRATIAKSEGSQNQRPVSVYHEGDEEHRVRNMTLVRDLRSAVQDNSLVMHYQPKIDVTDESVCGVEALVRWNHPTYGWLPPNDFIPVIEQSGNISILTRWALETVACQHKKWLDEGLDLKVAVNLSAHDLQDNELPWFIMDTLRNHRLPPEKLVLEITEQAMVQDINNAITVLTRLRDLGIKISIDDFGTGYSSLSQLKKLPVDELKIDRSFVGMLPGDRADEAIVSTTIDLAHKLRLEIVAEGVSSGAAYRWLQNHGIDRAQGFYWSKAIPAEELSPWVSNFIGGSTQVLQTVEFVNT
jgi:diguanylate cyclase (GGDEF)-like protein